MLIQTTNKIRIVLDNNNVTKNKYYEKEVLASANTIRK